MKYLQKIRNFLKNISETRKAAVEIREGIANQSDLLNKKLSELINLVKYQQMHLGIPVMADGLQSPPGATFETALSQHPLLFAPKTYNTAHPDYDANLVRNFPGKFFNLQSRVDNKIFTELKKLMQEEAITEPAWRQILDETLAEVKTVPHAEQVFERKAFVESYLAELEKKYHAFYRPGWVNLDDALFLYWVVRRLKPKTIVQTGVCNGLSSAFMMLALAKNGPEGSLHVIDMPPVFDPNDPAWTVKDKVYGVTIPEGKTSGWLVPDAYRGRFEVQNGDAKLLLPPLLKKLGTIDMFYHDSDHTYDHMMFEFKESKAHLTKSGVIVSDDISWNASLWDFADEYHVPAYNYRGSMGIACF